MVETFVPILETGQIDVVMMAMNFVDRHTYGFEDKVLPVANRHKVGVVCMKVFGGMRGGFAVADGPNTGPQLDLKYIQQAIRYALGLPGVAVTGDRSSYGGSVAAEREAGAGLPASVGAKNRPSSRSWGSDWRSSGDLISVPWPERTLPLSCLHEVTEEITDVFLDRASYSRRDPRSRTGHGEPSCRRPGLPVGDCPDQWNLSHPEHVEQVPRAYVGGGQPDGA